MLFMCHSYNSSEVAKFKSTNLSVIFLTRTLENECREKGYTHDQIPNFLGGSHKGVNAFDYILQVRSTVVIIFEITEHGMRLEIGGKV